MSWRGSRTRSRCRGSSSRMRGGDEEEETRQWFELTWPRSPRAESTLRRLRTNSNSLSSNLALCKLSTLLHKVLSPLWNPRSLLSKPSFGLPKPKIKSGLDHWLSNHPQTRPDPRNPTHPHLYPLAPRNPVFHTRGMGQRTRTTHICSRRMWIQGENIETNLGTAAAKFVAWLPCLEVLQRHQQQQQQRGRGDWIRIGDVVKEYWSWIHYTS